MTIKEFARKYSVPYHVCYKATFTVRAVATLVREQDYDEGELKAAIRKYIKRRLHDIKAQYEQYAESWKNLKE